MCVSCVTHSPTDLRLGAVLHLAGRVAVRCSCLRRRCDETRWSELPTCIYVDIADWSCVS